MAVPEQLWSYVSGLMFWRNQVDDQITTTSLSEIYCVCFWVQDNVFLTRRRLWLVLTLWYLTPLRTVPCAPRNPATFSQRQIDFHTQLPLAIYSNCCGNSISYDSDAPSEGARETVEARTSCSYVHKPEGQPSAWRPQPLFSLSLRSKCHEITPARACTPASRNLASSTPYRAFNSFQASRHAFLPTPYRRYSKPPPWAFSKHPIPNIPTSCLWVEFRALDGVCLCRSVQRVHKKPGVRVARNLQSDDSCVDTREGECGAWSYWVSLFDEGAFAEASSYAQPSLEVRRCHYSLTQCRYFKAKSERRDTLCHRGNRATDHCRRHHSVIIRLEKLHIWLMCLVCIRSAIHILLNMLFPYIVSLKPSPKGPIALGKQEY